MDNNQETQTAPAAQSEENQNPKAKKAKKSPVVTTRGQVVKDALAGVVKKLIPLALVLAALFAAWNFVDVDGNSTKKVDGLRQEVSREMTEIRKDVKNLDVRITKCEQSWFGC